MSVEQTSSGQRDIKKWRRRVAAELLALGLLVIANNDGVQTWVRHQRYPNTASAPAPSGMSYETQQAVRDQLRTALRHGGTESFLPMVLACETGNRTVVIMNPIVMVLNDGRQAVAAIVPGTTGQSLDVQVIDRQFPGAPDVTSSQPCSPVQQPTEPNLIVNQLYSFHFNNGDPLQPINDATGQPFLDAANQPLQIGQMFTVPNSP